MIGESQTEDEWFARHEEELLRQARRKRERAQLEASTQPPATTVQCPKCGQGMKEEDIGSIRIDRCSGCEGIFLDRGELEAIMLHRSEERRGFFRQLLGFRPE